MRRLAHLYFVFVLGIFAVSCGDEGSCPDVVAESFPITSGEYELDFRPEQDFEFGRPFGATLTVDRDARTAVLEYEIADGSTIVETYEFAAPTTSIEYY